MNLEDIKHDRLSEPEKFLLDMFDGLEKYVNDIQPDIFFYKTVDTVLFEYDSKRKFLWYSFEHIRVVFRDEFNFTYQETDELVQSMMIEYFNLSIKSTNMVTLPLLSQLDEYIKCVV